MRANLHIMNAAGQLNSHEAVLLRTFAEVVPKVEELIALPSVDVVVFNNPNAAIPETGVGGYSPNQHLVMISIDPSHANLVNNIEREMKSTLAHELHHCARWKYVGYGTTLLEALVSEGLADCFDIEVNGGAPMPWSVAINEDELHLLRSKATKEFYSENYDHASWFFGSEKEGIPRWAGYSLGYSIVQKYILKSGKPASALVGEPANTFIDLPE